MKLLDIAKKTLIEKTQKKQVSDIEWEEIKYFGSLYNDIKDYVSEDCEIKFNSSFKAMNGINAIKKETSKLKKRLHKNNLETELLLNRLRITKDEESHIEISEKIKELAENKIDLYEQIENKEIDSLFDIIKALEIVLIDNDKTYKTREDFENLDFTLLNNLTVIVTNFLSKRERIIPLSEQK